MMVKWGIGENNTMYNTVQHFLTIRPDLLKILP
jgi:hypothetical protein